MLNPSGLCQCGCGCRAPLAQQDCPRRGYVKGEPLRYVAGHAHRRGGIWFDRGKQRWFVRGVDGRSFPFARVVIAGQLGREKSAHMKLEHALGRRPRKSHCHNGHAYTEANTYWRCDGRRVCLTCKRENLRRYRARQAVSV